MKIRQLTKHTHHTVPRFCNDRSAGLRWRERRVRVPDRSADWPTDWTLRVWNLLFHPGRCGHCWVRRRHLSTIEQVAGLRATNHVRFRILSVDNVRKGREGVWLLASAVCINPASQHFTPPLILFLLTGVSARRQLPTPRMRFLRAGLGSVTNSCRRHFC